MHIIFLVLILFVLAYVAVSRSKVLGYSLYACLLVVCFIWFTHAFGYLAFLPSNIDDVIHVDNSAKFYYMHVGTDHHSDASFSVDGYQHSPNPRLNQINGINSDGSYGTSEDEPTNNVEITVNRYSGGEVYRKLLGRVCNVDGKEILDLYYTWKKDAVLPPEYTRYYFLCFYFNAHFQWEKH